ncbi:bacteriophage N4 adsorption protein B [Geobacter sp. OR-1]|uniref:GspE/PulE/PilB domain-containing protein n=1 Tax=Geobacter sp. OR-1 TaxID=1266765 RepID=UPI000541B65D|nr:hypothetical protein [Geobacter sp. OR-1]GAM09576.1 bacteriophage N4 adsorption protein B [Geobacter sp. OR-1]
MAITLLDMLLNARLINRDQFEEALKNRVLYGGKIGTSLIELGYVSEEDLARFLSKKLGVPYVHPDHLLNIPQEVIDLIPRDLAVKYRVIPMAVKKRRMGLIMSDPADLQAIDEIGFITGFIIIPLVTPEVRLMQALGKYYQLEVDVRYTQIIEKIEERKRVLALELSPHEPPQEERSEPPQLDEPHPDLPATAEAHAEEQRSWTEHISRFAPSEVSLRLARAENREEIADLVVSALGDRLTRVLLFVVRDDSVIGWKGISHQSSLKINGLRFPLSDSSALRTVTDGAGFYLGPLPNTAAHEQLIMHLGGEKPKTVLLMPLLIWGRVLNVLYAEGEDTLADLVPEIQKLLAKAALAFEVLMLREKIMML